MKPLKALDSALTALNNAIITLLGLFIVFAICAAIFCGATHQLILAGMMLPIVLGSIAENRKNKDK